MKRKMERGVSGPTVPGRKGSNPSGGFQSEETEHNAAMKASCVAKGKDWATTRLPRLSLPFKEIHSNHQPLPSCLGCIWVCISQSFTCLGFNHLTTGPKSLASAFPFLLTNFPSDPRAACSQPPTTRHWNDASYCRLLEPCYLNSRKTKPCITFASQVDKLSLFLLFLFFNVPPPRLLF